MVPAAGPVVVKLGGSLAASAGGLAGWLDRLARGAGRVVLVPGGGPFADRVRDEQARLGFSDAAAHHLALLAMEQYGRLLADLCPALRPADSRAAIRRALRGGAVPVWMPARMAIGRPDIPESWDVTSDSLALWLAGQIGARAVALVKSAPAPAGRPIAEDLAGAGLVDAAFPGFLRRTRVRAWYVGPDGGERFMAALDGAGAFGSPIEAGAPC